MSTAESDYLASLNDRELKAYHIAKDHLGMSFNLPLSNGYREWKKQAGVAPVIQPTDAK
jgi:hypothetical protein